MQAAEGVSVVNTIQNSIRKIVPSELSFCSWRWLRQINIFKYSCECKHSKSIRKYLMVLNSVPKKGAGQYCPAPYTFYYLTNL